MHNKSYPAYTDHDGTMREIVIVGFDHKKYFHLKEALPDGTLSVPCEKCYTHSKLKVPVRKELLTFLFRATPKKEPLEQE